MGVVSEFSAEILFFDRMYKTSSREKNLNYFRQPNYKQILFIVFIEKIVILIPTAFFSGCKQSIKKLSTGT